MRLRINPFVFVLRLVVLLVGTYLVWGWIAPFYLQILAFVTRAGVWLTELSFDPLWHNGTTILTEGTGIFYAHRNFSAFTPPLQPIGIPGDWIMANIVLLVALMLATPAPTWRTRAFRFLLAVALVLVLQVADIIVAIKVSYSSTFRAYWSPWAVKIYQFLDAFFQSFDTQLFPFGIWAGIHFRELVSFGRQEPGKEAETQSVKEDKRPRAERRRKKRKREKK